MENAVVQLFGLMILGIPVACLSWTVTHEEVFREVRGWLQIKQARGTASTTGIVLFFNL